MKIAALLIVSSVIWPYISVEAKPKVLSSSANKIINQYLDDIVDIMAEESTVSYKCTVY